MKPRNTYVPFDLLIRLAVLGVSRSGYGLGYLVGNNSVSICSSCFHSCADTDAQKMPDKIAEIRCMMKACVAYIAFTPDDVNASIVGTAI